jgi:hypothetical protein
LCNTEAEELELAAVLQQALRTVLQGAALADKADTAAAAEAAAAAAAEEVCDSEEGEELFMSQRMADAAADAEAGGGGLEADMELSQAMDMDLSAAAAAAAAVTNVCSTPPPPAAAAADMLHDDEGWQKLSSQAAEMSQLPCTPAPKAPGGSLPRWGSVTPYSPLGSQLAETLQQQQREREQQMLLFGMQTEQQLLPAGQGAVEVGDLAPSCSLEPATSHCIGATAQSAAAAAAAAAAGVDDVVDLTATEQDMQPLAKQPEKQPNQVAKDFWRTVEAQFGWGEAQKSKEDNPTKRSAGSHQAQASKRPKNTSNTKQH